MQIITVKNNENNRWKKKPEKNKGRKKETCDASCSKNVRPVTCVTSFFLSVFAFFVCFFSFLFLLLFLPFFFIYYFCYLWQYLTPYDIVYCLNYTSLLVHLIITNFVNTLHNKYVISICPRQLLWFI